MAASRDFYYRPHEIGPTIGKAGAAAIRPEGRRSVLAEVQVGMEESDSGLFLGQCALRSCLSDRTSTSASSFTGFKMASGLNHAIWDDECNV